MRYFLLLTFLLLLLAACEGQIPFSAVNQLPSQEHAAWLWNEVMELPTGSLSLGADGANKPIGIVELFPVSEQLHAVLRSYLRMGIKREETLPGVDKRGQAVVEQVKSREFIDNGEKAYQAEFTVAFHDFSVDGESYFGGGLVCSLSFEENNLAGDGFAFNSNWSGALSFAGVLNGTIRFNNLQISRAKYKETFEGEFHVESEQASFVRTLKRSCLRGKCLWK
ncbi:MAG: hypothetical protein FVQ81_12705 [Candidatus Glassbacteria bacterium]|nr:hypothetical protein [Candidatus Glassbacteria bacterium]